MKPRSSENAKWYILAASLLALLALLAVLQYQSSKQIRRAATEQILSNLEGSLFNLRAGLESELAPLCHALEQQAFRTNANSLADHARHFEQWRRSATHPGLVSSVYIWQPADNQGRGLLQLDSQSGGSTQQTGQPIFRIFGKNCGKCNRTSIRLLDSNVPASSNLVSGVDTQHILWLFRHATGHTLSSSPLLRSPPHLSPG